MSAPARAARAAFIDRIRVGLTALVLVHHTAITFGAAGSWYYRAPGATPGSSSLLTVLCTIDQAFFMGFFFLLAGYFTPASFDRRGARRYLGDRAIRLGIPLVVYGVTLGPFTIALGSGARGARIAAVWWSVVRTYGIAPGPLWFAEALLMFAVGYVVYRSLARDPKPTAAGPLPRHAALVLAAVATGIAAFGLRLVMPVGRTVADLQLGYFASYVVLFATGCAAAPGRWLERVDEPYARPWRWTTRFVAPIFFVYAAVATARPGAEFPALGGWHVPALAYAMWEPFVAWGIILTVLWRARAAAAPSPWWQTLSPRAYTVYVIHPPIVVAWSLAAVAAGLPYALAFVAVAAASIATTFWVAGLVLRIPGATRVL